MIHMSVLCRGGGGRGRERDGADGGGGPAGGGVVAADDAGGDAGYHAVVGDLTADDRTGGDDDVAADARAGEDDRARTEPAAGADADRGVHRELPADRRVDIEVAVVLVGYVHIRPGKNVLADRHRLVRHDVRAAPDHASVADSQHRRRPQVLPGHHPRGQRHLGGDQHFRADENPALTEHRTLRERHHRSGPECGEPPGGRRVRGHDALPLGIPPGPVDQPPRNVHRVTLAASWPQAPSISRPLVSRTVTGTPCASSRRTNSACAAGRDAVHTEPGVGFSGIRLTCARCPASSEPSMSARHAWSLMSLISAYSIDTRRPVAAAYPQAASSTWATRHRWLTGTRVSRNESSGVCSDTAKVTESPSPASRSMAGTSPTVDTVTDRCEMPSPSGTGSVIRRTAPRTAR